MATIKEDYCSKEIYRLLIEKGFDGEIHTSFDEEGYTQASITLQMAMKWIRMKGFHIYSPMEIDYDEDEMGGKWYHDAAYYPEIRRVYDGKIMYDDGTLYATPEQACEAAIKYCFENLI